MALFDPGAPPSWPYWCSLPSPCTTKPKPYHRFRFCAVVACCSSAGETSFPPRNASANLSMSVAVL